MKNNEKQINRKIEKAFKVAKKIFFDDWNFIYAKTEDLYMQKYLILDPKKLSYADRRRISAIAVTVKHIIDGVIGIKMEIPQGCRKCVGLIENEHTFRCLLGKIKFSEVETSQSYEDCNYTHPNCPLVDLTMNRELKRRNNGKQN